MSEKFMTLHPQGKQGTNIDRQKYEKIKTAILAAIGSKGELTFNELNYEVGQQLPDFDGSIGWYTTTVKLDLEARGLIERIPRKSPQILRLSNVVS